MPTPCFWLEPGDQVERWLRRFTYGSKRPCAVGSAGHEAQRRIDDAGAARNASGLIQTSGDLWPHDDPRWPTSCDACGVVFTDDDEWQVRHEQIFVVTTTVPGCLIVPGSRYVLRFQAPPDGTPAAPPGAMWDAPWLSFWRGSDGRSLTVRLPDGRDWSIDGPSSRTGDPGWTRSGTPPMITAQPSILTERYHGFLQAGVLTDDLEGRTYG